MNLNVAKWVEPQDGLIAKWKVKWAFARPKPFKPIEIPFDALSRVREETMDMVSPGWSKRIKDEQR